MPVVFVPAGYADALALRAGETLSGLAGCAATAALVAGLGPGDGAEEADFVALSHAGVLALHGDPPEPRLVLAVDVDADQYLEAGGAAGEVVVARLQWSQVAALFVDEPGAKAQLQDAHIAVAGLPLAAALELPAIVDLLAAVDLLWYDPSELDQLVERSQAD